MDSRPPLSGSCFTPSTKALLAGLTPCVQGSVVCRTLHTTAAGTITVLSFAAGQGLRQAACAQDGFVQVLEGVADLCVAGAQHTLHAGEAILLPAHVPYDVHASQDLKILWVVLKG